MVRDSGAQDVPILALRIIPPLPEKLARKIFNFFSKMGGKRPFAAAITLVEHTPGSGLPTGECNGISLSVASEPSKRLGMATLLLRYGPNDGPKALLAIT
jgi:hypothetical protein